MKADIIEQRKKETKLYLLRMLVYLYWNPGDEGEGGKIGLGREQGYPGTRLRYPSMPLWGLNPRERRYMFTRLLDSGMIEVYSVTNEKPCYRVTKQGEEFLFMRVERMCTYINWHKPKPGVMLKTWHMMYTTPEKFNHYIKLCSHLGANGGCYPVKVYMYEWEDEPSASSPALREMGRIGGENR